MTPEPRRVLAVAVERHPVDPETTLEELAVEVCRPLPITRGRAGWCDRVVALQGDEPVGAWRLVTLHGSSVTGHLIPILGAPLPVLPAYRRLGTRLRRGVGVAEPSATEEPGGEPRCYAGPDARTPTPSPE